MLVLFFALRRFLNAFCASCCVCCRSGPVLVGLGALRTRFWRVPGGFGEGFGGPRAFFFYVFSHTRACNAKKPRICKNHSFSQVFLCFLHIASDAHKPKNDTKSFQKPCAQHFPTRSCSKLVLGLASLAFGGVWGAPWPAFGRAWASLSPSWALLRRLVAASWALLGVSWLVWVVSCVHFSSPGRPGTRFWRVWDSAGLGFGGLRGHVLACLVLPLALHNVMI